jgi:amidohydrolase
LNNSIEFDAITKYFKQMIKKILSISRKSFSDIVKIRREIHRHPELAFEESNTAKIIERELRKLKIPVKTGIARTGVVGILRGELNANSPVVALRADMDALPITEESGISFSSEVQGKMHACGHDAHVAMLIGAARVLSEMKAEIQGTIKFIFQPSEEKNPGGALSMITEGVLSDPDVDVIFGQHITAELPVGKFGFRSGPMMASADEIYLDVVGRGGHGAYPHKTVDPIPIAAQIVLSLQNVISRMRNPFDASVLTIGSIHGGSTTNVIPDEVRLSGTFRSMNEAWRTKGLSLIRRTAGETAKSFGGKCRVEISRGYPVLVNSNKETKFANDCAIKLFGAKSVLTLDPIMGAEDFSYFLQKVPGTFWWIGAGNHKIGATASIHSSKFMIDENALMYGTAFLAFLTTEYLRTHGSKS